MRKSLANHQFRVCFFFENFVKSDKIFVHFIIFPSCFANLRSSIPLLLTPTNHNILFSSFSYVCSQFPVPSVHEYKRFYFVFFFQIFFAIWLNKRFFLPPSNESKRKSKMIFSFFFFLIPLIKLLIQILTIAISGYSLYVSTNDAFINILWSIFLFFQLPS